MTEPMTKRATGGHLAFLGTVVPIAYLGVATILWVISLWSQHHAVAAVATWYLLQSLLFYEVRVRIAREQDLPKRKAGDAKTLASGLAFWLLCAAALAFGYQSPVHAPDTLRTLAACAALVLGGLLPLALLRYFELRKLDAFATREHVADWCRCSVWISSIGLVSTLGVAVGAIDSQTPVVRGMMLLSLVPVLEWLVRTLTKEQGYASLAGDVRTVDLLFSRMNPVRSLFMHAEHSLGIDIRSTWALRFARRASLPLCTILALLAWLSTTLVTIDTFQAGIHERFGAPVTTEALGPGLHFKAPWPIDRIYRIDSSRVRTLPLGFTKPKPGASLLWTRSHAAQEYNLLLGDGRDLVTLNALLHYRVADPWQWHRSTQNPGAMLQVLAEQAVVNNTVNRSLDEVLSENLAVFARHISDDIRRRAQACGLGVEIVGLSLQGLHPPLRVAEDYQAVVSAQHERETAILVSRAYEITTRSQAQVAAVERISAAQSAAALRTSVSRGEAKAFRRLSAAHASAPASFEMIRRLDTLEHVLLGRTLHIIDDRIERDGGILWYEN